MSKHAGRGSPVDVSTDINCKKCELRDRCRDKRKSKTFACTYFVYEENARDLDKSSRAFRKMMRELVSSESVLTDTYNIDDRDLRLAPNFYRWCVGENFLAASPPPYPWQLEVGLHLFGDICPNPKCSDKRWYAEIPHDCDVGEIPERLSLRRRGVCPKCQKTRLDYINAGIEKDYNSYVGTVGQRSGKCLAGSTLVQTADGLKPIRTVAAGDFVHVDGTMHRVLGQEKSGRKNVVELVTRRGYRLKLTPDHRVLGTDSWAPARSAKSVLVQAYDLPWGSATELRRDDDPKAKLLAQRLGDLTRQAAVEAVHGLVRQESVSQIRVLLHVGSEREAGALQQYLLTKRIISSRVSNKVVLDHPWVLRYHDTFGIKDERVAYVAKNGAVFDSQLIGESACRSLYATLQTVEIVDKWFDPASLTTAAHYRNICGAGELTRSEAAECAEAYSKLQVKDAFLRHVAVKRLQSYARADVAWDDVVAVTKAGREDVFDIEVEDVHRFTGNGVVVHNSSGLGFVWSYHTHSLIKLKNPSAFYGIKAGTILHMNMIGLTYTGVKQAVWDPFMTTMSEAPWFKCIAEGTPVRMSDGSLRSIEEIVPGESVKTLEGNGTVDRVFDNGVREVFQIELSDGKILRLTEDHQVRCVIEGELVWLPISDINENTMVVVEDETDIRTAPITSARDAPPR